VKTEPKDQRPSRVQSVLEPDGQTQGRWAWVEPAVWNERMLKALETGVRGGKWHNLLDKVYGAANIQAAWQRVKANKGSGGIDQVSIEGFEVGLQARLEKIAQQLRDRTYTPQPVRRAYIPKPGSSEKRPLGIPTVGDRVVQTALRNVLEPIFERIFEPRSYGFRPKRRSHQALREVERLLAEGHVWIVDVDIQKYFDSIPPKSLLQEVAKQVSDSGVLSLIEAYLGQGVLEGMSLWTPGLGTPQGAVISPLLANIYLHPVDVALRQDGYEHVRYADDMVILCRTREEAEIALEHLRTLLAERGLRLHPTKTRIANLFESPGFQFLGYVFHGKYRNPREASQTKLRTKIRSLTKRTNGHSIERIIHMLNASLRGWMTYFQFCSPTANAWRGLDGYVRYRLRALLDKRRGGRTRRRGRGLAHQRWPNRFFTELGLFSLQQVPKFVLQS
jgi:RNA-directed DNA polymerase